jgi:hypothetical protein
MKVIELVIDENAEETGIDAISVVNQPAIEIDFVALSKQPKYELKEIDNEKRILLGASLVPNKQIYRNDPENGEYYIYFSKDTIRKASELFMKSYNQKSATYEHDYAIDGMTVVETWLVDNPQMDKAKEYGFDVPEGTWMVSMKVDNDEVWADVKAGKVKGFSIEGYFADKLQMNKISKDDKILQDIVNILQNYG